MMIFHALSLVSASNTTLYKVTPAYIKRGFKHQCLQNNAARVIQRFVRRNFVRRRRNNISNLPRTNNIAIDVAMLWRGHQSRIVSLVTLADVKVQGPARYCPNCKRKAPIFTLTYFYLNAYALYSPKDAFQLLVLSPSGLPSVYV